MSTAIGSGGGSIAWLDARGRRCGSVRSRPAPSRARPATAAAASRRRSPMPRSCSAISIRTISPAARCSSSRQAARARRSSATIAQPLGITVEQAALGIHRVLNAQMAEGIRLVSIGRGIDPRGYTLLPLGGGGAAARDGARARARHPPHRRAAHPGVLSAAGLLGAPVEHEVSAAFAAPLAALDVAERARRRWASSISRRAALMAAGSVGRAATRDRYFADVCYIGQSYHLEVPLDPDDADPLEPALSRFSRGARPRLRPQHRRPGRASSICAPSTAGGIEPARRRRYAACGRRRAAQGHARASWSPASAEFVRGQRLRPRRDGRRLRHSRPGDRRAGRHDDAGRARLARHVDAGRQPDPRRAQDVTGKRAHDIAPAQTELDPITVEVVRHKLDGIANEMQSTLLRSSFSPIVKEGPRRLGQPVHRRRRDARAGLRDPDPSRDADPVRSPRSCASLPVDDDAARATSTCLNDPYTGGTHLPDIAWCSRFSIGDRSIALSRAP